MTRTVEQILGLPPMNQFDITASPMKTAFVDDRPADNFKPWKHVPNLIPLTQGVSQTPTQPIPAAATPAVKAQTTSIETARSSPREALIKAHHFQR